MAATMIHVASDADLANKVGIITLHPIDHQAALARQFGLAHADRWQSLPPAGRAVWSRNLLQCPQEPRFGQRAAIESLRSVEQYVVPGYF
jgi:hypothetical protein